MTKYRKKPVVIDAMQTPFDTRSGGEWGGPIANEMWEKNRQVAIWMVDNGYNGNPDGKDTDDWDPQDLTDDGRPLPEFGINFIEIATLEGTTSAAPGDYIIRGVQGEFYPCKPDIFEATYEQVRP